jgi:prefoldin subunit 5
MKLEKLKQRCDAVEAEISKFEGEIGSLELELGNYRTADETIRLTQTLDQHREAVGRLMSEWEELSSAIEKGA